MNKTVQISSVLLLIFIGLADASVDISLIHEDAIITFDELLLSNPLGCIYVNDQYLTKLTHEEIEIGQKQIEKLHLFKKIKGKEFFRIAVLIEGFLNENLIKKEQANYFSQGYENEGKNAVNLGAVIIDLRLHNHVFKRFRELRQIRYRITAEGALWIADLNPIFMLSDEDREKLCGVREPNDNTEKIQRNNQESGDRFPPELDWSDMNGEDWTTPAKNQSDPKPAGTCWAFSAVATVEALINIREQNPDLDLDLAEQTLTSDCCRYGGNTGFGGMPYWAFHYVRTKGIPTEAVDPYEAENDPCDKRPSTLWKIQSYNMITWQGNNENTIKSALENHPLSTCVNVDDGWYSYVGGEVYSYTGPPLTGVDHAVLLVGWNDNDEGGTQTWKIKNSWGSNWGENGFMRLIRDQGNNMGWYTFEGSY